MKTNFKILSALLLSSLMFYSCQDDKPKNGGELISQSATLYDYSGTVAGEANAFKVNSIDIEEKDPANFIEKSFKVGFVKPLSSNTKVYVSVSEDGANQYMKTTGKIYEMLPKSYINLPKVVDVSKGEMSTQKINLSVNIDDNIKLNTPYIFAIRLDKVSNDKGDNIEIFNSTNTIVYTLLRREESTDITRVTKIERDVFFSPESSFPYDFPNGVTMECLINVGKFRGGPDDNGDAGISTLMGIEGKCLLRFGDAGVPPNVLQACGEKVPFKFSTNKWYHIAVVFTPSNQMIVYVDGNKISEYSNKRPVLNGSWYIGRSWNDNRGIIAKLSEVRIWTTVRSQEDIQNSIYGVSPSSEGLLAYWKMDKADGFRVIDVTGNGNNLVLKNQRTKESKEVSIVVESEPIDL